MQQVRVSNNVLSMSVLLGAITIKKNTIWKKIHIQVYSVVQIKVDQM